MKRLNVLLVTVALCVAASSPVLAAGRSGGNSGGGGMDHSGTGFNPPGSGSLFQSGSDDGGATNGGGAPLAGSDATDSCDAVLAHPGEYNSSRVRACHGMR